MPHFDEDDDDLPLRRPVQAPRAPSTPPPLARPGQDIVREAEEGVREGETTWRPPQSPTQHTPLTEADQERLRRARSEEEAAEARRIEEILAAEPTLLRLPALLAHPVALAMLLGLAALLGFFLFAQVTSTLAALNSLSPWLQYSGYAGLAFLSLVLLFAMGRLLLFYLRLQPNRPIRLKGLEEVARRTQLRHLVQQKKGEAREQLCAYLRTYPLDSERDRKGLETLGLSRETLEVLGRTRSELLDVNRFTTTEEWFSAVGGRFQSSLDGAAQTRIVYYARRVGVMTAVSPNTLMDTLLTLTCSFSMMADLCRLYNLRVGRLGTAVLLARVFFNAYLAGQLNELEGITESSIQGFVSETGLHLGTVATDAAAAKAAGKLGARAAAGLLNFYLLKRLGNYTARLLRPIHVE